MVPSFHKALLMLTFLFQLNAVADLSELPLNHLKITHDDTGKINIEARCAKLEDILQGIFNSMKIEPVFEVHLLSYENVWKPGLFLEPREWLDRVGGYAIGTEITGAQCRVISATKATGYDASLAEDEIRAEFSSLVPAQPIESGIIGGVFVFNGQYIPPPYSISTNIVDDGTVNILMNGIVIQTILKPRQGNEFVVPSLPLSGQFPTFDHARAYAAFDLYPSLRKKGMEQKEALAEVIKFLGKQDVVSAAFFDYEKDNYKDKFVVLGGGPILAVRKGKTTTELIFPSDFDFSASRTPPPRDNGLSPVQVARTISSELERDLREGNMVLQCKSIRQVIPIKQNFEHVLASLQTAKELPLLQAECVISEFTSNPISARFLAVKLPQEYDAFSNCILNLTGQNR